MALYVKFAKESKPRTVRKFIKLFYSNIRYDYLKGVNTYFDRECTNLHCSKDYRSFDDLKELIQTYYPTVNEITILKYLLTTDYKNSENNKQFYSHLGTCSTMSRIRFVPFEQNGYYDVNKKMKESKNTWSELLTQIGINNENEFLKYIKVRK